MTYRTGDEGYRRYCTVHLQSENFVDDEFSKVSGTDNRKLSVGRHEEVD